MVMVSKFSNFPDKLSENDELREYELSGSHCNNVLQEEKNVDEWLKGKAVEYYRELSTGNLTNDQIKERVEALKLNLSQDRKVQRNILKPYSKH